MLLRFPASPGNGNRHTPLLPLVPRMKVEGSPGNVPFLQSSAAKILGSPSQSVNAPVLGFCPCKVAKPFNSQLVGKSKPFCVTKGSPLDQRARPETVQPPRIASKPRLQFFPNVIPRPIGNS